jgi:hypothetical protein
MKKYLPLTFPLFVAAAVVHAQATDCGAIKQAKQRLACFDKSAAKAKAIPANAGSSQKEHLAKDETLSQIRSARERLSLILKDPDSVRFRSEFLGRDGAVCGFFNAKNSYGGYGGFERYIVTADRVIVDGDKPWAMDSRWLDVCADFESAASTTGA